MLEAAVSRIPVKQCFGSRVRDDEQIRPAVAVVVAEGRSGLRGQSRCKKVTIDTKLISV